MTVRSTAHSLIPAYSMTRLNVHIAPDLITTFVFSTFRLTKLSAEGHLLLPFLPARRGRVLEVHLDSLVIRGNDVILCDAILPIYDGTSIEDRQ